MTDSAITEPLETVEAAETVETADGTQTATVVRLTGKDLLAKIRELGPNTPRDEVALATGYFSVKKAEGDEPERISFAYTALYEATLDAKGMGFAPASTGGAGRKASYEAVVQKSGNLTISKAYTEPHGAEPGHVFKITLKENGGFSLDPMLEDETEA